MHLIVCFHTKRCHVVFGAALCQCRQDGNALGQANDLLVQLPGLLIGPAYGASATSTSTSRSVEELEAGDAILAGRVEDEPVLLPFLWK